MDSPARTLSFTTGRISLSAAFRRIRKMPAHAARPPMGRPALNRSHPDLPARLEERSRLCREPDRWSGGLSVPPELQSGIGQESLILPPAFLEAKGIKFFHEHLFLGAGVGFFAKQPKSARRKSPRTFMSGHPPEAGLRGSGRRPWSGNASRLIVQGGPVKTPWRSSDEVSRMNLPTSSHPTASTLTP
jgi:hypothetical protein